MPKLLHESPAVPLARSGAFWSATLLTPGQGSSGNYTEAMLSEHARTAFPKGTKNWFMHPESENQQRDPRDQWGVLAEDAEFVPGVGVRAKIQVLPHWQQVVESLGEAGQADLSIWAMGESDKDGNVTSLLADRQNSVDLVGYPGRPGSALTSKMLESARSFGATPPSEASADNPKVGSMEIAELGEAVKALTATVTTFITEQKAAATAVTKSEADATDTAAAVKEALTKYNEQAAAVDAAELLPSQAKDLKERALRGEDVALAIESAKAIVTEATARVSETVTKSGGVILAAGSTAGFGVSTWEA